MRRVEGNTLMEQRHRHRHRHRRALTDVHTTTTTLRQYVEEGSKRRRRQPIHYHWRRRSSVWAIVFSLSLLLICRRIRGLKEGKRSCVREEEEEEEEEFESSKRGHALLRWEVVNGRIFWLIWFFLLCRYTFWLIGRGLGVEAFLKGVGPRFLNFFAWILSLKDWLDGDELLWVHSVLIGWFLGYFHLPFFCCLVSFLFLFLSIPFLQQQ